MDDELQFFQSWWKILRKYWNPPQNDNHTPQADAFWTGLVSECRTLMKKYEDNQLFFPFAKDMCFKLIDEVTRRSVVMYEK